MQTETEKIVTPNPNYPRWASDPSSGAKRIVQSTLDHSQFIGQEVTYEGVPVSEVIPQATAEDVMAALFPESGPEPLPEPEPKEPTESAAAKWAKPKRT